MQRLPENVPGVQHGRLRVEAATMRQLVFDPVIEPILSSVHHMLSVPRRSDGGVGADVLIMAGVYCTCDFEVAIVALETVSLGTLCGSRHEGEDEQTSQADSRCATKIVKNCADKIVSLEICRHVM
jgi:hypothetical protein